MADLLFGINTDGGNAAALSGVDDTHGWAKTTGYTAVSSGTATHVCYKIGSLGSLSGLQISIYDSTGARIAYAFDGVDTWITTSTTGLNTVALNTQPSITSGQTYYIAISFFETPTFACGNTNNGSGAQVNLTAAYGTLPTSFSTPLSGTRTPEDVVLYVEGTAGASAVEVTSVADTSLDNAQTGIVISGSNFSATGNTVIISPTDDVDDVDAETQVITAEGASSITFTAVRGDLPASTNLYLFVIDDSSNSNAAGYVVQFNTLKQLKLLVNAASVGATVDGVVFEAPVTGIAGPEIGEFTGKTIVAGTGDDSGKGVLLVPVADFGGSALEVDDQPRVYLKNSTNFTPIWPGLVIAT